MSGTLCYVVGGTRHDSSEYRGISNVAMAVSLLVCTLMELYSVERRRKGCGMLQLLMKKHCDALKSVQINRKLQSLPDALHKSTARTQRCLDPID